MDLRDFLLARIAEDEAVVHTRELWPVGTYMDRWSPARVLAECDAKRRIVREHRPFHVQTRNDGLNWDYRRCVVCDPSDRDLEPSESYWPCPTAAALALVYANHPNYRDEWRP